MGGGRRGGAGELEARRRRRRQACGQTCSFGPPSINQLLAPGGSERALRAWMCRIRWSDSRVTRWRSGSRVKYPRQRDHGQPRSRWKPHVARLPVGRPGGSWSVSAYSGRSQRRAPVRDQNILLDLDTARSNTTADRSHVKLHSLFLAFVHLELLPRCLLTLLPRPLRTPPVPVITHMPRLWPAFSSLLAKSAVLIAKPLKLSSPQSSPSARSALVRSKVIALCA